MGRPTIKSLSFSNIMLNNRGSSIKDNSEKQLHLISSIAAHDKAICCVKVAPNDTLIATGSQDKTARIWSFPTLTPILLLRGHTKKVTATEFSPIDKVLATASNDRLIFLWSIKDGYCLRKLEGHSAAVSCILFLSSGFQLFSTDSNGLIKIWNIRTANCINTFEGHEDKISALSSSGDCNDNKFLITGSSSRMVLWKDCTHLKIINDNNKEQKNSKILKEYENAIENNKYLKAIKTAIQLKCYDKLYKIIQAISNDNLIANRITNILQKLDTKEISFIFEHCRNLNTRSSTFYEAHVLLRLMLNVLHPKQILQIQHIQDIMISLLNCTELHIRRLKKQNTENLYLNNSFLTCKSIFKSYPKENLQTCTYHSLKNKKQTKSYLNIWHK